MEDHNNMLHDTEQQLDVCVTKLKDLGDGDFIEVKAPTQRAMDSQQGVVHAFKLLANARNAKYEHVSKLSNGEASKFF
jgi:hypothetical protein